jgi:hypothetical protein
LQAIFETYAARATGVRVLNLCLGAALDASGANPDVGRLLILIDATVRQLQLRKLKPVKDQPHSDYHKIWRIVDGAVSDAFYHHPDYLTPKGKRAARESVVKRVTGAVLSSVVKATGGRSGSSPAPKNDGS